MKKHTVQVRKDRADDAAAYEIRVQSTTTTLEALRLILPKLKKVGSAGTGAVLAELAKIGDSNPISAFLTLASAIDPVKLANVVNKM